MTSLSLTGLLIVTALVPGFIFLKAAESQRAPTDSRAGLEELIQTVGAGLATVLPPLLTISIVRPRVLVVAADIARGRSDLTVDRVRGGGLILLVVLAAAIGLAFIYAWIWAQVSDPKSAPSAWYSAISSPPPAMKKPAPYATVEMTDGSTLSGPVHAFDSGTSADGRDFVLRWPIYRREGPGSERRRLRAQRMVIPSGQIVSIGVRYRDRG